MIELELLLKRNNSVIKYIEVYKSLVKDNIFIFNTISRVFLDTTKCQNIELYLVNINELDISKLETF